jgi:hypothetical protein
MQELVQTERVGRRREDDFPVEVELVVSRRRHAGRECLALSLAGERTVESRST